MPALRERRAPYVTRRRRPASRLAEMRSRPGGCAGPLLGERPPPYHAPPSASLPDALTERDLAHLWEGQRFPPQALTMVGGQPLQVIYRGLRGRGPGPDFRDAVIIAPWGTLKGDVELHVRTSDFRRHGHHRDHAYDRLVLHLVFWPDERPDTTLASGRRVPVAALAPWVGRRSEELRSWLERPALWSEPCRSANDRMGSELVGSVLDRLGEIRFRRRSAELRRALSRQDDPDEVLYQALLEALGYGGNREPFRLLALRLPWLQLRRTLLALPPERRPNATLEMMTEASGRPPPLSWRLAGLRPGNHPARRLEAAAHLAARYAEVGLVRGLGACLGGDVSQAISSLTLKEGGRTLIGAARAVEILTNALLPLLAAAAMEPRPGRALDLYRALPRPARYGSIHHLDNAVTPAVKVNARRQQGMLFLLRNYCSQGRCGSCPLS
ncbi:MAG: DUF2851 family protein [Chloroflexi bacterium]|nr:DUF2851 family protein [Chloroflexota bacterium]